MHAEWENENKQTNVYGWHNDVITSLWFNVINKLKKAVHYRSNMEIFN